MPIRPQLRPLYPFDWSQLSASIRFRRARGRCETCGRPHGEIVAHLGNGTWYDRQAAAWRDGRGRRLVRISARADDPALPVTRVVLAAAHLDHDPTHNAARNLRALCQRCHMLHDAEEHRRQRWLTLHRRKALGDLFQGCY